MKNGGSLEHPTHDQVYKYLKSTGYQWWSFQRKDLHQEALIRNLNLSKRRKLTATSFFKKRRYRSRQFNYRTL
jgi:hypothetical protein